MTAKETHEILTTKKIIFIFLWTLAALLILTLAIFLMVEISYYSLGFALVVFIYLYILSRMTLAKINFEDNEELFSDESKEFRDRHS